MGAPEPGDDVVAAARRGDGAALRAVYEWLAPAVAGYLRAKGVGDPDALTSDVFLAVLPQLPGVTGGADGLRRLVFTVAHARVVDDLRRRARRGDASEYRPEHDTRTSESAESVAIANLGRDSVLRVLRQLPDDQREVLVLRFVADLSVEQVAEVMGRSAGAVKQLQRRALIGVRHALAERGVTL